MTDLPHSLYYETQGQGPPVILLHGMAASLRQWDFLMPQLATAGFSVYALDLPGHGDSSKPQAAEHYHIEVLYEQLSYWVDGLGFTEPALLVGHSLGGYLSLIYTLRKPKKVRALVLTGPLYSPVQLSPLFRYLMRKPRYGVQMLNWMPAWVIDLVFRWNQKVGKALPGPMYAQLLRDYKRTAPRSLYITRTLRDLTPQLHRVVPPALVVWGSRDLTLSPESFPKIVAALPKAESYTFLGCGHIPHLTQAPTFNQLVLDFAVSIRFH